MQTVRVFFSAHTADANTKSNSERMYVCAVLILVAPLPQQIFVLNYILQYANDIYHVYH